MLISPAKKRYDELQQRLREIRTPGAAVAASPEEEAIRSELQQLQEQLDAESSARPAILKG